MSAVFSAAQKLWSTGGELALDDAIHVGYGTRLWHRHFAGGEDPLGGVRAALTAEGGPDQSRDPSVLSTASR